jgi:hypothetical protein
VAPTAPGLGPPLLVGIVVGSDYISVASKWLHKGKYYCVNVISAAALRSIWLTSNAMIFDKQISQV